MNRGDIMFMCVLNVAFCMADERTLYNIMYYYLLYGWMDGPHTQHMCYFFNNLP